MEITQAIVDSCLDTAVDQNGEVEILSQDPVQVCVDLGTYEKQLDGAEVEDLMPFVENWLQRRHAS